MPLLQRAELVSEVAADLERPVHQVLGLVHVQGGVGRGAGQRAGTERADVRAGPPGCGDLVVGEADSPAGGGRPLIEQYRNGAWQVASLPRSAGSDWTDLYGLAVNRDGTVWAVGTYLDKPRGDSNNALILRGRGTSWTVDRGPDPGSGGNILGGVAVIGAQVWAAGIYATAAVSCR